jgi:hypothetical protein
MFKTLAKSWLAPSRRTAPGPRLAITHSNDNLRGFAAKRRAPPPVLACHWLHCDGRLECYWHVEAGGAAVGGFNRDGHRTSGPATAAGRRPSPRRLQSCDDPRGRNMIGPTIESARRRGAVAIFPPASRSCAMRASRIGSEAFHITVFELSYQQCRCRAGSQYCRLWTCEAAGMSGRILSKIRRMSVFLRADR